MHWDTERAEFMEHSDRLALLALGIRCDVSPELWDRINDYACGMVTLVRLGVDMVAAHQKEREFR